MQYHSDRGRRDVARNKTVWPYAVVYSHLDRPDEVVSRHATRESAERACAKLQRKFEEHYPKSHGISYLCGWSVEEGEF